jgi:thiopurine S-methyltransferase
MDPDFWHERWKTNQIGFHQGEINHCLVRYWPSLGLKTGGRVLVPLCGKSRDMFWLLEQGFAVTGIEISPIAVEAFFAEPLYAVENRSPGNPVRRFLRTGTWRYRGLPGRV